MSLALEPSAKHGAQRGSETRRVFGKYRRKGHREQFVACAQAFGETRSTRSVIFWRAETRRVLENIGERGTENYLSLALKPSAKHGGQRGSETRRVLENIGERGFSPYACSSTLSGESERRQWLAPCHLSPQQHRAAEPPSSSLSNYQTVKLSNYQTIQELN